MIAQQHNEELAVVVAYQSIGKDPQGGDSKGVTTKRSKYGHTGARVPVFFARDMV